MKKINNKIALFVCIIMSVLGCCSVTFAAESSVTNSVETSIIDISLSQSHIDEDGNRVEGVSEYTITPNKNISLVETITNEGADCYVRAKVTTAVYKDGELMEIEAPFTMENLNGLSDDWIVTGDYIYFTGLLEHGVSKDMFEGITIPATMGNEYAGTDIILVVIVEAVQSDFFTPDFGSSAPWGDLTSEACIREGYDYAALRVAGNATITVYYEGGAGGIVILPDDFCEHFAAMLPGGSYTGTATVANNTDDTVALYFKTDVTDADNELLNELQLSITEVSSDGSRIPVYEGSLNSEALNSYLLLDTYEGTGSCELEFTIIVPENLKNEYSLLSGSVDWYFMAQMQESDMESPTEETNVSSQLSDETEAPVQTESAEMVKSAVSGSSVAGNTGDQAHIVLLAAAVIGALILISICAYTKKGGLKKENNGSDKRR